SGSQSYQNRPGIAPQQLGNESLQWERTSQFNIGTEVGLFRDRLGLEVNLYNKFTSNALLRTPLPATIGFSAYWSNSAKIRNKGLELSINSVNIHSRNFTWSTHFNISKNVNKIESLDSPLRYGSRDLILLQQGTPMYS